MPQGKNHPFAFRHLMLLILQELRLNPQLHKRLVNDNDVVRQVLAQHWMPLVAVWFTVPG
jgi:hypothetical protein